MCNRKLIVLFLVLVFSSTTAAAEETKVAGEPLKPEALYKAGRTYFERSYDAEEAQQLWSKAIVWFRKAAEQGYAPAEFSIGRCYQLGYCGAKDEAEAANWYRKSAEHGYWWAQDELSRDYYSGRGVTQDYDEAYFWHLIAADARAKIHMEMTEQPAYASKLTPEREETVRKKVADWEATHPSPTPANQPEPAL